MIGAAPGTSGEGQNPGQEARTHFSLGVCCAAGALRDSWDEHLLPPASSPAGNESSAKERSESEAFSIPRGSCGTRGSQKESVYGL